MYIVLFALLGIVVSFLLLVAISAMVASTKKYYSKDSGFYRFLVNFITVLILKLGRVKLHVTGAEKLTQGKKLLFVGNHLSNFDPMVTYYAFKKWRISYIAKASILNMPLFGRLIRRCCFMDIDRENPRNALVTINRAAQLLKDGEVSIGVYPEGTRSKTGELLPFHNGVFKIAQKADADIAVVALYGTDQVAKNFPLRRTHVNIDILEVFSANEVDPRRTEVIGKRVEELLHDYNRKRDME